MDIQAFGPQFDLNKFLYSREQAIKLTHTLAKQAEVGMSELDLYELYKRLSVDFGVEKNWHPPKFRIGKNTIEGFRSPLSDTSLKAEDIFFVDIGPVIENHEADYGEPFAVGENFEYKRLVNKSREIFEKLADVWKKEKKSGGALYQEMKILAEKEGYRLNPTQKGHRVSDFPHALIHKGTLYDLNEEAHAHAWILEVHLIHSTGAFGAFFEDMLF